MRPPTFNLVCVNGLWVERSQAVVSVFDRSFRYGDGLFETLRVFRGVALSWREHWERLCCGGELLRLRPSVDFSEVTGWIHELIRRNDCEDGILRLHLSRGAGGRGYSTKECGAPVLVATLDTVLLNPGDEPWRVRTCSGRLRSDDPLARVKSANKLLNILGRMEADDAGVEEGVFLNNRGEIAEGTSTNLFWFTDEGLCTPALDCGILDGITRGTVLTLARKLGWEIFEARWEAAGRWPREGVFLTSSVQGIRPVSEWDGEPVRRVDRVAQLQRQYAEWARNEAVSAISRGSES